MKRSIGIVALGLWAAVMMGCQNQKLAQDRLYAENQELRQQLQATGAQRDQLAAQLKAAQQQLAAVPPTPAAANTAASTQGFAGIEGVETEARNGNIYVRIPGDVLFDSGKTTLKSTAQKTLDQIAAVIKRDHPDNTVRIEGYTDTDPIKHSRWEDNLELSSARAAAVFRYLDSQGLDPKKMYAAGFGEYHPRDTKPKSRRVEIVVVKLDS